jgi:hypothetical protein
MGAIAFPRHRDESNRAHGALLQGAGDGILMPMHRLHPTSGSIR